MKVSTKKKGDDEVTRPASSPESPGPPAQAGIPDPSTRTVVDVRDADALIDLWQRMDRYTREASETRRLAAEALAALTEGDAKTRYVRGQALRAKVEIPDDGWDNSLLLEAWNAYPKYRDAVLRIGSIRVMRREWNKIAKEAGPPDFEVFRNMIGRANRGPCGTPRITVVEGGESARAEEVADV